MTENKRFNVKQRQGATNYSIIDYYGELPLSEGMYYKSNAEKLCKWLNTQHELLNTLYKENEQLKEIITGQRDTIKRDNEWENKAIEEIKELKKENEQLKQELNAFKPVMFQDMRKGTVILYSKNGDVE